MKSVVIPLVAAIALTGCSSLNSPKCKCQSGSLVGNWGLKLPYENMNAGHLIVEQNDDGSYKGLMLWRWASPVPTKYVKVGKNGQFELQHAWGEIVKGQVIGDTIVAEAFANSKKLGTLVGWRNSPICPKASTKNAKFGEGIDLLADGLDGWVSMEEKAKFGWSIVEEDGVKVLSNKLGLKADGSWAGGGANLRTKRDDFFDFHLSYDVRVPAKSNSGVYLRGRYEIQVVDSFGKTPDCHNMAAYYGRVTPSVAAEKAPGQWQHVEVTLYKRHLTVELNGKVIIDDVPVVGITGGAIDANENIAGPIYLQGDHSDADFKNMILRPAVD